MHYWKFNSGDWAKITNHLSLVEYAILHKLDTLYRDSETSLPTVSKLARKLRVTTEYEHTCLLNVLEEFFIELPDGTWKSDSIDADIAIYAESQTEEQKRKTNERDRQRRHRNRRQELFSLLREKGIVPDFDTPTSDLAKLLKGATEEPVTRDRAVTERDSTVTSREHTTDITAITINQEPLTTNHKPSTTKPKNKVTQPLELPDWLSRETWDQFSDHRKAIGKAMTANAAKLIINKLEQFRGEGQNPDSVLVQSIVNGWTGIFPVKNQGGFRFESAKDKSIREMNEAIHGSHTASNMIDITPIRNPAIGWEPNE